MHGSQSNEIEEETNKEGSARLVHDKENMFTSFSEFAETQDDLFCEDDVGQVLTQVESVGNSEDKEEADSVIYDFTDEPLFRGDAYFGSVRTAVAVNKQFNVHFLGVVKQYSANYPKEDIVSALEGKPAGTKIVLTTTVRGVRLVAIGYNQKKNDTVCLLMTEGAASTMDDPRRPRVQKFLDKYRNVCVRRVNRPKALNEYYRYCGLIDDHNRLRQGYLQLEKKWLCKSGFARIFSTIVGMNLVDTYLLWKYKKIQNVHTSKKRS